jgi:hypothetical protein
MKLLGYLQYKQKLRTPDYNVAESTFRANMFRSA